MENSSIREFTCNDCQEVTKVDWSKVRPDIDDGTSNIEIYEKGNKFAYYGECENCGNLVEIEPPVPELIVDNVDVSKDGISVQITDTVTNRSCWIDAWKDNKSDEWEYDFNQYIFHLDNDNDIVAKMFQEDLGNYSDEVFDCVMGAIDDHEDEYNKLQENKAPTMRDRLKEAKSGKERYKKVQITYECDDCGHRENWLFDNIAERELAEEEASDSNMLVGDCPKCNSKYYNMKDYKIIEENKDKKIEAKYTDGYIDDLPQEYPEEIRNKYYEYVSDIDLVDDEPLDFINWVSKEYPDVYNEIEKEAVYKAVAYYDDKLRGVEDETSSSDWSDITDFAHDKLMKGSYVKITNTTTGKEKVISPDTYQDEFDGEFVVAMEELDESVGDKSVKITAYGKIYYEFPEDEWNEMSEENKQATIADTADQATEEEGHIVENDEVEVITESKLNEDKPQEETLDEAINRAHQEEIDAINTYDTILSKTDETTDAKLVEMIEEIKADEEDHKLLLQHYIETGEALTDDELEELKNSSSDTDKEIKEEAKDDPNKYCALCGKEKEDYEASMCDDCWEKEKARLSTDKEIKEEAKASSDVIEYFGMQDNTDEKFKANVEKEYTKLRSKYPDKKMILNGDFGTYLGTEKATPIEKGEYITVYEEANSKSLDKHMEKRNCVTESILNELEDYDAKLYNDVINTLRYYFDDKGTPIEETSDINNIVTDIQSKYAFDYAEAKDIVNTFINDYKKELDNADNKKYSKEDIKNLLDNGNIIKVGGKLGNTPSKFLIKDNKLYFQNVEITGETFIPHQKSVEEMIDYIYNLQDDGFSITSQDWDDSVKIEESKSVKTEAVNKTEMQKTSELSDIEIIENLEGGELVITDVADWDKVVAIASDLSLSQGFYGRLLRDMKEAEEDYGGKENLPFPITM